ncbi:acyl-CoA synthetase [Chloroflexota bacterium]
MNRTHIIAVIGDSNTVKGSEPDRFAEKLGELIIDQGWRIMTGGLGGIMESAARGARKSSKWSPGCIIGLLPGNDPDKANSYIDTPIPTGLDHGRNLIVSQADAVIAIGGGAGTLSEIALAWVYFRLIVAFRGSGWAGEMADRKVDERSRYPDFPEDQVFGCDIPEEAIDIIKKYLPFYTRRHHGI